MSITAFHKRMAEDYKSKHGGYPDWYMVLKKGPAKPGEKNSDPDELEETLFGQIRLERLPAPQRQYKWHPTRQFRADFAYPDRRILIEVQGGVYAEGRHNRGASYEGDRLKINEATLLGWRVLEFGPRHVLDHIAVSMIRRALETWSIIEIEQPEPRQ